MATRAFNLYESLQLGKGYGKFYSFIIVISSQFKWHFTTVYKFDRNIVNKRRQNYGCTTNHHCFNTSAQHHRWRAKYKSWRTNSSAKFRHFILIRIHRLPLKAQSIRTRVTHSSVRTRANHFSGDYCHNPATMLNLFSCSRTTWGGKYLNDPKKRQTTKQNKLKLNKNKQNNFCI